MKSLLNLLEIIDFDMDEAVRELSLLRKENAKLHKQDPVTANSVKNTKHGNDKNDNCNDNKDDVVDVELPPPPPSILSYLLFHLLYFDKDR